MNRILKAKLSVTVKVIDGLQIVEIDLRQVEVADWTLNLCLLSRGLVESLTFVTNKQLRIEKDEKIKAVARAIVTIGSDQIRLVANPVELGYWESFFLKYYRDSMAPVDHIDVEALAGPDLKDQVDVIFKVGNARPPLSAEEVRKLIGM